jgi:hypothetical protein
LHPGTQILNLEITNGTPTTHGFSTIFLRDNAKTTMRKIFAVGAQTVFITIVYHINVVFLHADTVILIIRVTGISELAFTHCTPATNAPRIASQIGEIWVMVKAA